MLDGLKPPELGRGTASIALVALLVLVAFAPGVTAQQSLSISVDVPNEVEVGEQFSVSASITAPDLRTDFEKDMTVTMSADGQQVASKTVTIGSGGTKSVSFTHTFQSSGSYTITVGGSMSVLGQTFSDSVSKSIDVVSPPTPTVPEPTPTVPEPTETPSLQQTSVQGAAFAIPESLEDEVNDFRSQIPVDIPAQAFVLATEDQLYLTFTSQEPTAGVASVEGRELSQEFSHGDLTFGVIAASSVSFDTTGSQASVSDVAQNPDQYRLKLVKITATHRQIASLTDPDSGQDFTLPITTGMLVSNPQSALGLIQKAGEKARTLAQDPSTANLDSVLGASGKSRLFTFSFAPKFWTDTDTTVDGIVLTPQSTAMQFLSEFDRSGFSRSDGSSPVLYVINEQIEPRSIDSVSSIKSQASSLDGEVVEVEARLFQERISVQEMLEHNTGCSEDQVQVKEACVNAVQDSLLHAGAAWNEVPSSREDILFVLGASSRHQDSPEQLKRGQYRIVGEVVSTSRVSESPPEGSILLVYELERTGDISFDAMQQEARTLIENQSQQMVTKLRTQVIGDGATPSTGTGDQQTEAGATPSDGGGESTPASQDGTGQQGGDGQQDGQPAETPGGVGAGFTIFTVLAALAVMVIGRLKL